MKRFYLFVLRFTQKYHLGSLFTAHCSLFTVTNKTVDKVHFCGTGYKVYLVGGTSLETGEQIRIAEYLDTRTGLWEEDFNLRKGT